MSQSCQRAILSELCIGEFHYKRNTLTATSCLWSVSFVTEAMSLHFVSTDSMRHLGHCSVKIDNPSYFEIYVYIYIYGEHKKTRKIQSEKVLPWSQMSLLPRT